eukprot:TRINITY_DN9933_c0_g1_i3.p1 TRINITY_DN9933_c0_g1~~TRINITY_DN9933_c0_g1_i3.p1  ORF type:complete len:562 (+),score=100.29 TRINITY_DN9933_c0_g1_i3:111-1796(+)
MATVASAFARAPRGRRRGVFAIAVFVSVFLAAMPAAGLVHTVGSVSLTASARSWRSGVNATMGLSLESGLMIGAGQRPLQVLGLQNTGTNLLKALLFQDLGMSRAPSATELPPPTPAAGHVYQYARRHNQSTDSIVGVWKHANLAVVEARHPMRLQHFATFDFVGVAMVRDPLSWLRSMKKAPYELKGCVSGDDWLVRPCYHITPDGDGLNGETFSSLEDIWNQWVTSYERLEHFGFSHHLVIRYEDLVFSMLRSVQDVARLVGTHVPAELRFVPEDAQKDHGSATTLNGAKEKMRTKSYLAEFTQEELRQACSRLDKDLMARHGYGGCQGQGGEGNSSSAVVQEESHEATEQALARGREPVIATLALLPTSAHEPKPEQQAAAPSVAPHVLAVKVLRSAPARARLWRAKVLRRRRRRRLARGKQNITSESPPSKLPGASADLAADWRPLRKHGASGSASGGHPNQSIELTAKRQSTPAILANRKGEALRSPPSKLLGASADLAAARRHLRKHGASRSASGGHPNQRLLRRKRRMRRLQQQRAMYSFSAAGVSSAASSERT